MSDEEFEMLLAEYAADECDDGPEPPCVDCDGEGYVLGEEIADYYDFGWIDPAKVYRCKNCGGSGLRKDQTVF